MKNPSAPRVLVGMLRWAKLKAWDSHECWLNHFARVRVSTVMCCLFLPAFLDSSTLQLFFDLYHSIPPTFSPLVSVAFLTQWAGAYIPGAYIPLRRFTGWIWSPCWEVRRKFFSLPPSAKWLPACLHCLSTTYMPMQVCIWFIFYPRQLTVLPFIHPPAFRSYRV